LKNVLDGPNKVVLNAPENASKVDEIEFEAGQVYTVDLMVTTGDGKLKASEARATVFKRNPDAVYQLKMKTSRLVFSQICKSVGSFAFSLKQLEDEKKARMGIIECQSKMLVQPFQVMEERAGESVAHLMYTVLLLPGKSVQLNAFFDQELVKSEVKLQDEKIVELLNEPIASKKNKK
jgi:methionine aminopeptidase